MKNKNYAGTRVMKSDQWLRIISELWQVMEISHKHMVRPHWRAATSLIYRKLDLMTVNSKNNMYIYQFRDDHFFVYSPSVFCT